LYITGISVTFIDSIDFIFAFIRLLCY